MGNMIGPMCHRGPGGRGCHCCNDPAGKNRKTKRRSVKRGERSAWRVSTIFKKPVEWSVKSKEN
jgi:hypothetical protein